MELNGFSQWKKSSQRLLVVSEILNLSNKDAVERMESTKKEIVWGKKKDKRSIS